MSDLARQYPPGHELAIPVRAGSSNDAVVNRPNSASDPDVSVNGQEGAKGGGGTLDV